MPFVTFQNVRLHHCEYSEHALFSMNSIINEDLGMNGLSLIEYKYWHCSHKENYVQSHTFDPWNESHWFFPKQRTCFVRMLWMHRETILKHFVYTSVVFLHHFILWISWGGMFASHKSFTRTIPAKETADVTASFEFLTNYSTSPRWATKLKACNAWKFHRDSCILALGWIFPMIKSCSLRLGMMVFNVYLWLMSSALFLSTILPSFAFF